MAKRMLIDAAHPEETRVVVLNGHRLEEFDFETSTKKQIKGNIYLAKVTRVEPSLQAAFVEYGGNRHGFLAFGEIHPDYYRIPVADRRAALEADRAAEAAADEREEERVEAGTPVPEDSIAADAMPDYIAEAAPLDVLRDGETNGEEPSPLDTGADPLVDAGATENADDLAAPVPADLSLDTEPEPAAAAPGFEPMSPEGDAFAEDDVIQSAEGVPEDMESLDAASAAEGPAGESLAAEAPADLAEPIETVGGDEIEETTRRRTRTFRHYKIQEVIKRRQIMLVQVTKEERGNKGAALTTYISLAGRYCVLMPNTPRGGGVSRKITSMTDRRRLKELMDDLQVPEGMGVIVRTAGSERSKSEIKRDFEYLLRLWDDIRELTLKSTAPALVYEEGNLIKRSIRDLYARDIDEVLVDGREGYDIARSFMRMLMPSHTRRVKFYNDPSVPLFHRFQVEGQLDAIHSPTVQLRSGGYIVINPTEALVAIDVNSGRSTRERNIEETALKTNLEAAEEIARQLRLRDLAGLIVVDFIDMEEHRNNTSVERRIKDAMRYDRARIQLGRISPFGLLELSRQRLRPSLLEASTQPCPHCAGTGHIRSTESTALHVLRAIEEEGMRRRSAEIAVAVPSSVALYILNQKRGALQQIEGRYGFHVMVTEDDTLVPPAFRLERTRALTPAEIAALPVLQPVPLPPEAEEEDIPEEEESETRHEVEAEGAEAVSAFDRGAALPWQEQLAPEDDEHEERGEAHGEDRGESAGFGEAQGHGRRRRRRRRRGGERDRSHEAQPQSGHEEEAAEPAFGNAEEELAEGGTAEAEGTAEPAGFEPQGDGDRKRRRRGRRGGRRRRRGPGNGHETALEPGEAAPAPELLHEEYSFQMEQPPPPSLPAEAVSVTEAAPAEDHAPREMTEVPAIGLDVAPAPATTAAEPPRATETLPPPTAAEAEPDAERPPAAYNVPPTHEVSGPAPNPRRGWWRRLRE